MITASTVEAFENCENLLAAIPKTDPLFSLNAAVSNLKKVVFKADDEVCGLLLYEVLENERGEKVFFISAFSVDAKSAADGGDIYNWIEAQARDMDCDFVLFDSPRRGMLEKARIFDWKILNIRYGKRLKNG